MTTCVSVTTTQSRITTAPVVTRITIFPDNSRRITVEAVNYIVRLATSGIQGPTGLTGPIGPTGATGPTGAGFPVGGSTGQVLAKQSGANYDTLWKTLDKSDVGLSAVDNTSDANKPVSSAQATAISSNDLNKFEKVSKNIRSYPYSLSYSGGVLSSITYTTSGSTSIVKTFNYTAGLLTSIVLSGNLPVELVGVTTKTLTYTAGNLTSISYS